MNARASGTDVIDQLTALHQKIVDAEAEIEQLRAKLADIRTAAEAPKESPASGTPILGGEQNSFPNFTSIDSAFNFTLEVTNTSQNLGAAALTATSSNAGSGVWGEAYNSGTGVYASSRTGEGLIATSIEGIGAAVETARGSAALYCNNRSPGDPEGGLVYGLAGIAGKWRRHCCRWRHGADPALNRRYCRCPCKWEPLGW